MGVDTHVTCCTGQRFPFTIGNVLLGLGISVLFRHAKVDDVNHICSLGARSSDEEVVRFDIAIDQILFVDRLDTRKLVMRLVSSRPQEYKDTARTICLATITTVLTVNRRLQ